ncbi:hypothetical protein [Nesterenkonia suensis]
MLDLILIAVFLVLLVNLVVAALVGTRQRSRDSWLLIVLLSGTTGAALTAVLTAVLALSVSPSDLRMLEVGLILTALAALTAAVRTVGLRRSSPQAGRGSADGAP